MKGIFQLIVCDFIVFCQCKTWTWISTLQPLVYKGIIQSSNRHFKLEISFQKNTVRPERKKKLTTRSKSQIVNSKKVPGQDLKVTQLKSSRTFTIVIVDFREQKFNDDHWTLTHLFRLMTRSRMGDMSRVALLTLRVLIRRVIMVYYLPIWIMVLIMMTRTLLMISKTKKSTMDHYW